MKNTKNPYFNNFYGKCLQKLALTNLTKNSNLCPFFLRMYVFHGQYHLSILCIFQVLCTLQESWVWHSLFQNSQFQLIFCHIPKVHQSPLDNYLFDPIFQKKRNCYILVPVLLSVASSSVSFSRLFFTHKGDYTQKSSNIDAKWLV